jgi:predicted Fe-Mo cluster-binding NifX family protein
MRIAVPTWQGRVSPLLDTARHFFIFETQSSEILSMQRSDTAAISLTELATFFEQSKVDMVICGALTAQLRKLLEDREIKLCPWVRGDVHEVLQAFLQASLADRRFRLPGKPVKV